MAPNRTMEYAVWKACARFGVRPPGVVENWVDCSAIVQGQLIAYDQIASHDEQELAGKLAQISRGI